MNDRIELLKVSTTKDFKVGDLVVGQSSRTQGIVKSTVEYISEIETESSSTVEKGWNTTTGFFNDNQQRIPDNFYYQNFSYSIKSKIPFDDWNDVVSSLLHTSGFKKFADLQVESQLTGDKEESLSIVPIDSTTIEIDMISVGDLECVNNFDLATENYLQQSVGEFSDEITFNTRYTGLCRICQ